MDRAGSSMVEEDVAAALPLCVRRLRGPGRARRLPPGTAYRAAGAVLRRVLVYNEDGQARVQVVRSDGVSSRPLAAPSSASAAATTLASSSTAVSLPPGLTEGLAAVSAAPGVVAEVREDGYDLQAVHHMSSEDADQLRTKSQVRRERAATLVAETERRYEEERESSLAGVLQALPLLRVVPPLSLHEQTYTREAPATAAVLRDVSVPPQSQQQQQQAMPPDPSLLRGVAPDRFGVEGQRATALRDHRGLGLSSAVLLSEEETDAADTPHRTASATAMPTAANATTPTVAVQVSPDLPSTLVAADGWRGDAAELTPSHASVDATAAALNGTSVDGGMGVTVRLGYSCDEPGSLRCLAWGGCRPTLLRAVVWRLLSDYAPVQVARQRAELQRKRRQYEGYTRQYCSALTMPGAVEGAGMSSSLTQQQQSHVRDTGAAPSLSISQIFGLSGGSGGGGGGGTPQRESTSLSRLPAVTRGGGAAYVFTPSGLSPASPPSAALPPSSASASSLASHERAILHQMLLDLPRHQSPIFHARRSVAGMARCLFLWAQRHPAVGYVQGMDDVVAIFYHVFLADALRQHAREQQEQQEAEAGMEEEEGEGPRSRGSPAALGSRSSTSGGGRGGGAHSETERATHSIMRLLLTSLHPPRCVSPRAPTTPKTGYMECSPAASAAAATTTAELPSPPLSSPSSPPPPLPAPLSPYLTEADVDVFFRSPAALDAALAELPASYLTQVEADTYACAGRVLSFLQDNFMTGQPGILRNVRRLEALMRVVDPAVVAFLDEYGLTVMDGCFQWLHCLLARELPLSLLLRLWDCYLAIGVGGDQASAAAAAGPAGAAAVAAAAAAAMKSNAAGPAGSDEAIMYFHVCVCCALLRALWTSLTGGVSAAPAAAAAAPASPSPATAAATTAGGLTGWAAAIVTALPGFRTRAGQTGKEGMEKGARPPIDVVMTSLKKPFESLFPGYPTAAVKQRRLDALMLQQQQQQKGKASQETEGQGRSKLPVLEVTAEEVAAEKWLDLLIADAYCIWRLHPLRV